jgi:hypothetical protein
MAGQEIAASEQASALIIPQLIQQPLRRSSQKV